ncbi:MAG: hypothetical protein RLZ98_3399 [Pseudomonadota bacterium]|jgi:ethanolamine utilization protein EutA
MHDLSFDHEHPSEEERKILAEIIWESDNVELRTVGVDVGSSTSHLMFARVHLQRLTEGLSSQFVVAAREILWKSPILLTPYRADYSIDAEALARFIDDGYQAAGLAREDIDSGAVILTGEALKRRKAREIAELFSAESGKFVCASAGHHLEALMAAHGSGAVGLSRSRHNNILNIDIGGGTTKLALMHGGNVLGTAAFAVGGRLIAWDERGQISRIEGPGRQIAEACGVAIELGQILDEVARRRLGSKMADLIVEIAGTGPRSPVAKSLMVTEDLPRSVVPDMITFSGGVAEYIFERETSLHCDLGEQLAGALVSALGDKRLAWPVFDPGQGIRATVIGASQFSVQVSGNTILVSDERVLPLRNVPVTHLGIDLAGDIDSARIAAKVRAGLVRLDAEDGSKPVAIAFKWTGEPFHSRLHALGAGLAEGLSTLLEQGQPLVIVMEGDVGRALGRLFAAELGVTNAVISIDGVQLQELDFIDIGEIIRPTNVVPLVIKSLLFSTPGRPG